MKSSRFPAGAVFANEGMECCSMKSSGLRPDSRNPSLRIELAVFLKTSGPRDKDEEAAAPRGDKFFW